MKIFESRPCVCNRVTTGKYYNLNDCIDCWSYYFDPVWSERWGKPADKKPPHPLLEDLNPEFDKELRKQLQESFTPDKTVTNASQELKDQKPFSRSLACINLGTIVSRANCNCPLKFVHNCDKHGKCVRGPQLHPDIRSCLDCPDYEPDDPNA